MGGTLFSIRSFGFDPARHMARLRSDALWRAAAEAWYRIYYPYIPYETGRLADDVRIGPKTVVHAAPYARYVYEGRGASAGDGHALASAHWDRQADPKQLARAVARLIAEGGP